MKKIEVVSEGIYHYFKSDTALSFRVGASNGGMMIGNGELSGALYISEQFPDSTVWKVIAVFKSWEHVAEVKERG